ncbi:MAG: arabinogalactan endo-1,4-beta-galactosidase [Marinilabiliales bacterium]|nr:MAG: arabinogalactan endo-1,4-beta-galactosidase [Marinilabiliales bacterium]
MLETGYKIKPSNTFTLQKNIFYYLILFLFIFSCSKKSRSPLEQEDYPFILSADLSSLPLVESKNIVFYNLNNKPEDLLTTLKNNGINTVRLRLWHTPQNENSGFSEVKTFSEKLHSMGFKVWLSVHYSDTWADPGHQIIPQAWEGIEYDILKDSISNYTTKIVKEINPDIFQIGNEINPGFLLPYGDINNETQFIGLLKTASEAIRNNSENCRIMIHYAGINGSDYFFSKMQSLDYDIIGLSFYPIWHGKDMEVLSNTINQVSDNYKKSIAIAETAYPFTLGWNDYTNNIIGLEDQIILPDYPASPQGQKKFISTIINIVKNDSLGFGVSYWGAELIAFDGPTSENGSPWENQAFYDFDNTALPVIESFNDLNY